MWKNEFALNYDKELNEYSALTKIQFTECSFHHSNRAFCWKISLFSPNDVNIPILTQISPSFKVFARKPSNFNKKRKFDDITQSNNENIKISNDLNISMSKVNERKGQKDWGGGPGISNFPLNIQNPMRPLIQKKNDSISDFKEFATKLDDLLNYSKNLDGNSKKFCLDFAIRNFLIVDPVFTQNIIQSHLTNTQYTSTATATKI